MVETSAEGVFSTLVTEICGYLRDGISVHVVGPHGSGRSELLRLATDRLDDDGIAALKLYGNRAWRQEPYGALVAAGIGAANVPTPRRSAGEISSALAQQLRGGPVVVVVDDADDLDPPSVGALLTAHRQRHVVALTASRPHHPLPPDSLMLGLSPAVRILAPILDIGQVQSVASRLLDGPVGSSTLARIAMKSGGLYGLVRAIVSTARRTGVLDQRDHIWRLTDDVWSGHLAAAVEPFLAGSSQEVWDGATSLALSGPLPLEEAEQLLGRSVLDQLFTSGLVRHVIQDTVAVVGIYPPLLAEYLQREGSAFGLAQAHLTGGIVDARRAAAADDAVHNLQIVREATNRTAQARAEWERDPSTTNALQLAVAMRATNAAAREIRAIFDTCRLDVDDEPTGLLLASYASWLTVAENDLPAALALLDAHEPDLPGQAGLLRATRAHLIFLRDAVPGEAVLADVQTDTAGHLEVVRAEILTATGRVRQAQELLAGVRPGNATFAAQARVVSSMATIFAGDLEAGIGQAVEQLHAAQRAAQPGLIQGHSYVAVLGLTMAGRLSDAAAVLFGMLSSATVAGFHEIYRAGLLTLGAEIATAQGRREYARALIAQARSGDDGTGPYPGMAPGAVAEILEEDAAPSTAGQIWTLVEDRLERGYVVAAILLAAEAVERGDDPERRAALRTAAAAAEGPLLSALLAYVDAVGERHLEALEDLALTFTGLGARFYAIRSQISRAVALRQQGKLDEAAAEAGLAWRSSAIAGYERSGLFARLVEDVGLTEREVEIVGLLGTPHTTAQVAQMLGMSVRTVETHLHNAARKAGISGRDALIRAVSTWLRASA